MSGIGPYSELVAILRNQLATARVSPSIPVQVHRSQSKRGKEPVRPDTPPSSRPSSEDLTSDLFRRVASIDRADPDKRRKAFRIFIESVLLVEWGQELINDPAFYQLVTNVLDQMALRPELMSMMDEAGEQLLQNPPP